MPKIVTELQTSREGLVLHLADQFTSSTTFLSELLQNARRSGSPDVRVSYDHDNGLLTVEDSGSGIESIDALFTLGGSGFRDDPNVASERPFGMGFAACLFAAEHMVIETRAFSCALDTESVLQFAAIEAELSEDGQPFFPGTRISLRLKQDHLEALGLAVPELDVAMANFRTKLDRMAAGFPIPVSLNGDDIERPDSLSDDFIGGSAKVRIVWDRDIARMRDPTLYCYLQGLPVRIGDRRFSGGRRDAAAAVVHLDDSFRARVPDRDVLVEADRERARAMAEKELGRQLRAYLLEQQASMPVDAFVERYWDACLWIMPEAMTAFPLPPSRCFRPCGPLRHKEWEADSLNDVKSVIAECVYPSSRVVRLGNCLEDDPSIGAHYLVAKERGLIVVDSGCLPAGHWAETVPDLEEFSVEVEPAGIFSSSDLAGRFAGWTVVFCDHLLISTDDTEEVIRVTDQALRDPHDPDRLLWPRGACLGDARSALLQFCSYCDEWGAPEEEVLDHDEAELRNIVLAATVDLNRAVKTVLDDSLSSLKQLLRGRAFSFRVDPDGKLSVSSAT